MASTSVDRSRGRKNSNTGHVNVAATTGATGVRVSGLTFCRLECDHSELFQAEYKRSNRTKGLKILRYCGSSLHVIVQTELGASITRSKLAESVALFARFECSTDAGLRLGDTLTSEDMQRDTQSEDNAEGRWIPAMKERATTVSSAMKSVTQSVNENTLVYQLNHRVYSRWYYDWESGANKAQRLMRHVLKAYVFERVPATEATRGRKESAPATAGTMLRVIGVISSPEFTVISYRRAPSNESTGNELTEDAATLPSTGSRVTLSRPAPALQQQLHPQPQLQPHSGSAPMRGHASHDLLALRGSAAPKRALPPVSYAGKRTRLDHDAHAIDRSIAAVHGLAGIAASQPPRGYPPSHPHPQLRPQTEPGLRPHYPHPPYQPLQRRTASYLPPRPHPYPHSHPHSYPQPPHPRYQPLPPHQHQPLAPMQTSPPSSLQPPMLTLRDASPAQLFEDRVLWEHAHADSVTISKNLALVVCFVRWTPLDLYAGFVDDLVHHINTHLLATAGSATFTATAASTSSPSLPATPPRLNCFARVLYEHAQPIRPRLHDHVAVVPELEVLLRAVAQAALWFFSEDMTIWTRAFAQRWGRGASNKSHLRAAFVQWLREAEHQLNQHVFARTPLRSLAGVAEEIIAAVYTHERFHPKRAVVRQILGEHGFSGWRSFVAQMREWFIASTQRAEADRGNTDAGAEAGAGAGAGAGAATVAADRPRPPRRTLRPHRRPRGQTQWLRSATNSNPLEYQWTQVWHLDVDDSVYRPTAEPSAMDVLSLVAVLGAVVQLTHLQLALDVATRRLSVRSWPTVDAVDGDGMALVLDGKSRVCRFLPNGWPTATSDGAVGDYIGTLRLEAPDRLVVYLELFQWSRSSDARSYHLRLRLECYTQPSGPSHTHHVAGSGSAASGSGSHSGSASPPHPHGGLVHRLVVSGDVLETSVAGTCSDAELKYMSELKIGAKMRQAQALHERATHMGAGGPLGMGMGMGMSRSGHGVGPEPWRHVSGFQLSYHRR